MGVQVGCKRPYKTIMQLLSDEDLVWSPIVANSSMNRGRYASGINSYEKEFKFKPELLLEENIKAYGQTSWLDLCCGEGNALIQAAAYLSNKNLQEKVRLKGVDLVDAFQPIKKPFTCIDFEVKSLIDWTPEQQYDLITCSHGLHYIGNKIKVIEIAMASLSPYGLFIANLDINSICITGTESDKWLKHFFKTKAISYSSRTKLIKHAGTLVSEFGLTYFGADDAAGPNYTGQAAVTSYYSLKND